MRWEAYESECKEIGKELSDLTEVLSEAFGKSPTYAEAMT
jgi:hypothetical protein